MVDLAGAKEAIRLRTIHLGWGKVESKMHQHANFIVCKIESKVLECEEAMLAHRRAVKIVRLLQDLHCESQNLTLVFSP
jgi:hypothetical protein